VRILVKLGGTLLDAPESRQRLAQEIAAAAKQGHSVVVVHGGGKQMTRYLTEKGIESRFVNGLRVTTPEVLDAVVKIVAGSVNQELVAAFIRAGAAAVGLSGVDALLVEAEAMSPDLGFVGRTVASDARVLEILTSQGYLPVVACIAADRQGQIYNVNADQLAVACAAGFRADKLLFLTDVEGVRGAANETVAMLTPEECRELISAGIATGGMQAKLNAATAALEHGVREVVIAPGSLAGVVQKLMAGEAVGTRLIAAAGAVR
jgi:acetylglutamate kinase